ncbi:MAG: S-layer homology domain-containing protein [Firmicutes bacterium]|nr:S-layer homology domain-containing protein [Bacillota bacterium]
MNESKVLNDGKVSYDPDTKTLTLNGANVTGAANRTYTRTITDACGIYSTHALTINLVGSNTVNGAETSDYGNYGIFVSGKLTFTSSDPDGSLTVSGGESNNNGNAWVPGVYASGITLNNCNVTVSGGTAEHDTYPVSYAMSTAPTLVGVKATASRNRDGSDAETYSSSNNRNYKWIKIEQDATNTTIASPVIEPDSCYFTNNVTVTISCLTNGAKIYYSTDGTNFSEYRNAIPINDTTTITAYATKDDKTSATITATFTKRDASATPVTSVILDKSELDLKTNQNENLVATVTPANASDATVVWTSNDPSVATIDARGNVTTVGIGKARITETTKDGGYIAFCDVIVTEREPVQITFSDESGTVSPANTNAYGKLDNLPTPTRSGYSFDGWYTAAEGGTAVTTDTVFDKATTIYAHWTRNSSGGSHTTYYPVNTPVKSEGGSVVVSQKSASKGSAVTVTVTPESGYQVSSVQAVDKDGKKLTLTDKGDGKYTFVMPGSKVEVSASFAQVQKPEEASPYRDVSKDSYYYDAVQWASDKGITNGVADGVFAPDWVCTRGQIVTFLWRSVGSPAPKTAEMPFADVAEDAYYAQAVLWAVENGITKGTSETTFSPDQTCTRAHAVAFLYRLAGSPAVTGNSFQDVAADAYYNAAVAWAVQQGITNGTSETTFSPNETCTRAQIVTFLYRMDQAK